VACVHWPRSRSQPSRSHRRHGHRWRTVERNATGEDVTHTTGPVGDNRRRDEGFRLCRKRTFPHRPAGRYRATAASTSSGDGRASARSGRYSQRTIPCGSTRTMVDAGASEPSGNPLGWTAPMAWISLRSRSETMVRCGCSACVFCEPTRPSAEAATIRVFFCWKSACRPSSSPSSILQIGHPRPRKNTSTVFCLPLRSPGPNRNPSASCVSNAGNCLPTSTGPL